MTGLILPPGAKQPGAIAPPNLDQAVDNAMDLAAKIAEITALYPPGQVATACIQRVMAITEQKDCPHSFKGAVVSMFAGAIREIVGGGK